MLYYQTKTLSSDRHGWRVVKLFRFSLWNTNVFNTGQRGRGDALMPKARILYIEDSETQGTATKDFLETSGYEVTWVRDGMSVFRVAKTQPIDVILLDRVLPDMDGNRVCNWLKQDNHTNAIPIIMLTALNATAQKVQGLEAGADDYLTKPYDEIELNARVYAALRTKALRDELSRKNDELQAMLRKVEALSITNPLTGLYNRRRFEEVLDSEFKKSSRYNSPLSCMMMDIDHFKNINDTYGHSVGDMVIKDLALLIQQGIRDVDTPSRWGGEEFIVLAPMTPQTGALIPARRILQSVADHVFTGMGDKKVRISIGIADISVPGIDSTDKLVQAADVALYTAKKNGRNRIELAV
jgi:diguanylate cyclase (GGDEF)-like protein